jgi:acetyl/propionyl-CoA carboxylase alpha subunit
MKPKAQRVRDRLWVQWHGRLYSLPADLRKTQASARSEEDQELVAPFSCKVLKIQVQNGGAVKKGDPVVVVEAMKMEYTYSSPRNGRIARVLVREGQVVQGGAAFVEWKD